MKLEELLLGLQYDVLKGTKDIEINNVQYDNRKIKKGDLFICIKGFAVDGHSFAKDAIEKGASAIICEDDIDGIDGNIIRVKDTRIALAVIGKNYFGNPCDKLKIIGITGTNGKTTSAFIVKSVLEEAGYNVGLIGTVANYIKDKRLDTERTTPESFELQKLFKDMVDAGVEYCVMEVSSHSLDLNRVYGINFLCGIFTNLTQDHLDFHKTFENYFNAKYKLFEKSKIKIVNRDEKYGKQLIERLEESNASNIVTFSVNEDSDYKANIEDSSVKCTSFLVNNEKYQIEIPGLYNVYNSLGVIAALKEIGIDYKSIYEGMKKSVVPGRCERVGRKYNVNYEIIIDYAHTPDGLENILKTAREFTNNRLISVFGCGGDRDRTKRPQMGKISEDIADISVVTSDNPRTEEPVAIINDILEGMSRENHIVVENRKEAIKEAIYMAKDGDVIVIAGKGHETYQILKNETIHFDEREVVDEIMKSMR